MYEQIEKNTVVTEISMGSKVYCADFKTLRLMDCAGMTLDTIIAFINNDATLFFKEK